MTSMTPSSYIIGIIVFTMFIMGGMAMMNEFQKKDATFVDTEKYTQFNSTFNRMNDVTTNVNTLQSGVTGVNNDYGAFGVLSSLIAAGWNSLILIFTSFGFMGTVFGGLSTFFGIPTWVVTLVLALISVSLVFAIFSAIFQKEI